MTNPHTNNYQNAATCLVVLRAEVDKGLKHLHELCTLDGRFSAARLDDHQKVCYELAFCVAEIAAADAVLNFASREDDTDKLCVQISLAFCADCLQSVWQRLFSHAAEAGISNTHLLNTMADEPLANFIEEHGSVANLAAIGSKILSRGNIQLQSGLDEEKEMVRNSFARFADDVVKPQATKIHREDADIPDELIAAAAQLGCFGTSIPERYGGSMPDTHNDSLGMIVVTEELSRGSLGAAGSLITRPEIAARALLAGGTEQQMEFWLPKLAAGERLAAIAITEPDCGSDVAKVALKASKVNSGWVLNGAKTWCTFAGKSDVLVTLARTDPDIGKGHRGLSLFLVEKPRFAGHGFTHDNPAGGSLDGKAIPTIGYRGMHSYDLSFADFFVPDVALVGGDEGQGQGFYYTMTGFSGGRIQTAARASGVMQAAIEDAVSYAQDRRVFGSPVGDFQLTQVKLARMVAALTASRQFSYAVARKMDAGNGQMEASLVKLYSCHAAEWVTREAMQIHGGMGYAEESDVSRYFVDARVLSIFEGAEETLALKVIARDLIANAGELD